MARHASPKEIGKRIREARLSRKPPMTGEELAHKIDTDKGTVSRIERGEAGLSVERLQRIAEALGVDAAALLRHESRSRRSPPATSSQP